MGYSIDMVTIFVWVKWAQSVNGKIIYRIWLNAKLNIQLYPVAISHLHRKTVRGAFIRIGRAMERESYASKANKVFADRFLIALSRIKYMNWNGMHLQVGSFPTLHWLGCEQLIFFIVWKIVEISKFSIGNWTKRGHNKVITNSH